MRRVSGFKALDFRVFGAKFSFFYRVSTTLFGAKLFFFSPPRVFAGDDGSKGLGFRL